MRINYFLANMAILLSITICACYNCPLESRGEYQHRVIGVLSFGAKGSRETYSEKSCDDVWRIARAPMFLDRLADKAYERSRAPKTRINPTITRNEAWKSTSRHEGAVITYNFIF